MSKVLNSLDQVIGQKNIIKWFQSCIKRDALPQVIMLSGPTGIGKTSIAKIVACEIAYLNHPDKMESAKDAVINKSQSTDAVRVYNMSNLKSQEAVNEVKSDLTVGLSSTGRKVIIMDEAHGMSEEAQDSLLVAFESLQPQVYIIVCSTELESFRDAFVGRCVLRRLTNLSQSEMRDFLSRRITENGLKFELQLNMVYQLIALYTGREPRRAINLLDSFEQGSTVTTEELESFLNVYEGKQIVALIDHLYKGEILQGLDFISDLNITKTFLAGILEYLRVAEGGRSELLDRNATLHVQELIQSDGIDRALGFAIDTTTCNNLTRNKLAGYFLKWCGKADKLQTAPKRMTAEQVKNQDLVMMQNTLEQDQVLSGNEKPQPEFSLEMLLSQSESLD